MRGQTAGWNKVPEVTMNSWFLSALAEIRMGIRAETISDRKKYLETENKEEGGVNDGAKILNGKQKYSKAESNKNGEMKTMASYSF